MKKKKLTAKTISTRERFSKSDTKTTKLHIIHHEHKMNLHWNFKKYYIMRSSNCLSFNLFKWLFLYYWDKFTFKGEVVIWAMKNCIANLFWQKFKISIYLDFLGISNSFFYGGMYILLTWVRHVARSWWEILLKYAHDKSWNMQTFCETWKKLSNKKITLIFFMKSIKNTCVWLFS